MTRKRETSLRSFAHLIALKLHRDGEGASPAKTFRYMCEHSGNMQGGPISTSEMELLATEFLPEALVEIRSTAH